MAKFELYLKDFYNEQLCSINKVNCSIPSEPELIEIVFYNGTPSAETIKHSIYLDKSTAIKFAKILRTEINKITEQEVNNG